MVLASVIASSSTVERSSSPLSTTRQPPGGLPLVGGSAAYDTACSWPRAGWVAPPGSGAPLFARVLHPGAGVRCSCGCRIGGRSTDPRCSGPRWRPRIRPRSKALAQDAIERWNGDRSFHHMIAEQSADLHTVTSASGRYRYVSPASLALFGWEPGDLLGRDQEAYVHPDDSALVAASRSEVVEDPSRVVRTVCRVRCADGSFRWAEALARASQQPDGEVFVVSTLRDIGDRAQSDVDLQRQATTDPLTGVANRTVFMDRLQQALRRLDRRTGLVAVLFLDLDRFKLINDSVGHLGGDAVLLQIAERLRHSLRPTDTLARLGGDEFAIVVEDMSTAEEVVALATRIIEAGRVPFEIGDDRFTCTTSVGIAVTADSESSAERLLQEADLALYRAKDRGRDRTELFDEDLRTRAV